MRLFVSIWHGQDVATVRGIRDQIDTLVQQLLAELARTPR